MTASTLFEDRFTRMYDSNVTASANGSDLRLVAENSRYLPRSVFIAEASTDM